MPRCGRSNPGSRDTFDVNERRSRLARIASIAPDVLIVAVWTSLAIVATVRVVHLSQTDVAEPFTAVERSFGIFALALVPITGFVAGRSSFGASAARVAAAVGLVWFYCAVAYGAAMFSEPGGDDNSSAVGAGLVVLGIPLLVILTVAMTLPALLRLHLLRVRAERSNRLRTT